MSSYDGKNTTILLQYDGHPDQGNLPVPLSSSSAGNTSVPPSLSPSIASWSCNGTSAQRLLTPACRCCKPRPWYQLPQSPSYTPSAWSISRHPRSRTLSIRHTLPFISWVPLSVTRLWPPLPTTWLPITATARHRSQSPMKTPGGLKPRMPSSAASQALCTWPWCVGSFFLEIRRFRLTGCSCPVWHQFGTMTQQRICTWKNRFSSCNGISSWWCWRVACTSHALWRRCMARVGRVRMAGSHSKAHPSCCAVASPALLWDQVLSSQQYCSWGRIFWGSNICFKRKS